MSAYMLVLDTEIIHKILNVFIPLKFIDDFKKTLVECNAIISGSFVLRLLTDNDKEYNTSDMDVYVNNCNFKKLSNFMLKCNYVITDCSINVTADDTTVYKDDFAVTTFVKKQAVVQICRVVDGKNVTHSLRSYDFTFLINYYDGISVYSAFPEHIINRSGSGFDIKRLNVSRIIKYIKRGFTITINNDSLKDKNLPNFTRISMR